MPRGPRIKIKHLCKRKLKELGWECEPEGGVDSGGDKDDEAGSTSTCQACWDGSIEVSVLLWVGNRPWISAWMCNPTTSLNRHETVHVRK